MPTLLTFVYGYTHTENTSEILMYTLSLILRLNYHRTMHGFV